MAHSIERLRDSGITDIVVTVHYLAGQIRDYFGDGSDFGVELSYSTETRPLGTAGGVKAAHAALRDAPFLVLSGDAIANVDLAAVAAHHVTSRAAVTMVLTPRSDPREFGVAVLDEGGSVQTLVEKPGWGDVLSDRVNTGIYCVSPHVLDLIPDDEASDWARTSSRRYWPRGAGDRIRHRRLLGGCRVAGRVSGRATTRPGGPGWTRDRCLRGPPGVWLAEARRSTPRRTFGHRCSSAPSPGWRPEPRWALPP